MQSPTPDALLNRLDLGVFDPGAAFLAAVALYRADPLFCVPHRVREIMARRGADTPVVVLGRSDFGAHLLHGFKGRAQVLHVVDDFRCHRGEQFLRVDIISTDRFLEMAGRTPDLIAVNACRTDQSRRFFDEVCRRHGVPHLNFEQATRAFGLSAALDERVADWGPTIARRCDDYLALAQRMADPSSSETLFAVLTFHLTCNPEWFLHVARPYSTLYVRSGLFALSAHEKMVDCGASIGESTSALIGVTGGRFERAWMIEPDKINVATLQGFLRKFAGTAHAAKLSLHPVAVGEHPDRVPFSHIGNHGGAVLTEEWAHLCLEADYVQVERIDDIVDDAPTIIKMDIEGFELAALRGAAATIRTARPKLMLSAYHRASDLLDMPRLVDTLVPDYRIGLRHHTEDRWDTCLYFY